MSELPFVSCLCPTYHRPQLLANAVACFLAQDYPADRRELIIIDDSGELGHQTGEGWHLLSIPRRFESLPAKFNAIAGLAAGQVLVVWEDDDVYLPWHISAHVAALALGDVSKPSRVLSLFSGRLEVEDASRRFHASLAFSREVYDRCGGWLLTRRADFDRQFIDRLSEFNVVDPCGAAPPSYIFRWLSTRAYHGQSQMRSPDDQSWYDRCQRGPVRQQHHLNPLKPMFDTETADLMARWSVNSAAAAELATVPATIKA